MGGRTTTKRSKKMVVRWLYQNPGIEWLGAKKTTKENDADYRNDCHDKVNPK